MKGRNVLRAMLVMALLAVVFAVPANADQPEIYRETYEEDGLDPGCGFDIPYHLEGQLTYKLWFDRNGEAYGDSYKWESKYTVTYNGHQVTFHNSPRFRFTWITNEMTLIEFSGSDSIATLPGHGIVRATTGRIILLETCQEEGDEWVCDYEIYHWSGLDFLDAETICNYLLYGE